MNMEEALMLLDRICENDSSNNDTCTYDVDPVIALNSVEAFPLNIQDEISLEHVKDCTIPDTLDSNNNSFNIGDSEKLFESLEENFNEDPNDPDYNISNEADDSSDGETIVDSTEDVTTDSETLQTPAPENAEKIDNTEHGSAQNESLIDEDPGKNTTVTVKRSRKRTRQEDQWRKNIRKRQRQAGKQYTDSKGNVQRQREIKSKKDCEGKCKFRCSLNITADERNAIFSEFWNLSDDGKQTFYAKTTERVVKERVRTKAAKSRRKYSYKYIFIKDEANVRVCKEFYLSTIDISQRRIEWYHDKAARNEFMDKRGKHTKPITPDDAKTFVREHIESFPRMPSHYCRASSSKEYLAADLNLTKMYNLYVERCSEKEMIPVKSYIYRNIFNTEFNIGFHIPKKDRCD